MRLTLLPALFLALAFFLVPVSIMLYQGLFDPGFTLEHFERFFTRGAYLRIFLNSIQISAIVGLICVLIGYPTAYFIVRQPRHRRPLLLFLVLVPMWMSVLVRTYAWMVLLGREGMINLALIHLGLIDEPVKLMYTSGAVYIAMVQILLPIAIVTCYGTMADIDQSLLSAARIMGASPVQAFRRVFLPLSLEGAVTGFLIVFILSMGFFIVPALVGGPKDMMIANVIATQMAKANWGFAASVALLLLIFTALAMAGIRLASRKLLYSAREDLS
ncbi:ABC transporter permease [uncultured Paracoccus sp.]|uniref:ABC transporter permease n=1 Tax=uncultured Paracoccus sp. TaxID=189685 RepID=UPI002610EE1B|nr:ABC transporter permease [uncultured Paracoccus sp.]